MTFVLLIRISDETLREVHGTEKKWFILTISDLSFYKLANILEPRDHLKSFRTDLSPHHINLFCCHKVLLFFDVLLCQLGR